MQESQKIKWEVGQTVWCILFGKGTVSCVDDPDCYPVAVNFGGDTDEYYTLDGAYALGGKRSLFFSEPKVEAKLYPPFVPTFSRGDIVVLVCRGTSLKIPVAVVVQEETETMLLAESGTAYNKKVHDIYRTEKI